MIVTRLDADAGGIIPPEIIETLGLKPGDSIGWHFLNGRFIVRRAMPDEEIDEETGLPMAELRALIDEARDGPTLSAEEAFAELRAHAAKRRAAAA